MQNRACPRNDIMEKIMSKPKVLFLCTGNSARSQMAEGLLRALAGEHFDVFSAGTEPKGSILPEVQEAMREVGIDTQLAMVEVGDGIYGQGQLRICHHRLRRCRGKLSRGISQHGNA